ncbi:MAG: copper homeostasis protein CutC [Chitinophagales bacterium]
MMETKRKLTLEVCANGIQSALNAQEAGAHRVELCSEIEVGGITPTDVFFWSRQDFHLPAFILNRPREGDFFYTEEEFEWMINAMTLSKRAGFNGMVFGILKKDFTIDVERCAELVIQSYPLSPTFNRAFDRVKDPFKAMEQLIDIGFDRILTSGQKENCLEGSELIAQLVTEARGRIIIVAGGGITEENISEVVKRSGANEFHFSAKVKLADGRFISDLDRILKIKEIAEKVFLC